MSDAWESTIRPDVPQEPSSWENTIAPDTGAVPEPTMLSALGRGGLQGATFGTSDEIVGALEAAGRKLGGNSSSLSSLYEKARDESRAANKSAEESYPWTYGAGNIAGGLAPAVLTAGASAPASIAEAGIAAAPSLGKLAATGAASGALSSLGNSEKQGTELAKDVGLNALFGGMLGPALGKAAEFLGPGVQKTANGIASIPGALKDTKGYRTLTTAFDQGLKGRRLFGESAQKALGKEMGAAEKEAGDVVQEALSEAGRDKFNLLTQDGEKVNLQKWYEDFQHMSENLKQARGQDPQVVNDIDKIKNIVDRSIHGDNKAGLYGKGFDQTPEAAESLRTLLGSRGSLGDKNSLLQTNEGSQLINRMVSPLKHEPGLTERSLGIPEGYKSLTNLVNESRPGLEETNKSLSTLMRAKDEVPSIYDIANNQKVSLAGADAAERAETFLSKLPEDVASPLREKITDLSQAKKVADKINAPSLSKKYLGEGPAAVFYGGSNALGLSAKALYEADPLKLVSLSKAIGQVSSPAAQKVATVLQQASQKDQFGRNALLFTLQQNPAYRQLIDDAQKNETVK